MIAKIWRNRILAGDQIFSECPDRYKEDVKKLLQKDLENGRLTQEEYDEIISK